MSHRTPWTVLDVDAAVLERLIGWGHVCNGSSEWTPDDDDLLAWLQENLKEIQENPSLPFGSSPDYTKAWLESDDR